MPPFNPVDSIMGGKFAIEKGVIGSKEFTYRKIVVERVAEKSLCLRTHCPFEIVTVIRQELL